MTREDLPIYSILVCPIPQDVNKSLPYLKRLLVRDQNVNQQSQQVHEWKLNVKTTGSSKVTKFLKRKNAGTKPLGHCMTDMHYVGICEGEKITTFVVVFK